ncbi:GNAT family N-acetyltransferase [Cloacibacillus sp. An23]|uniref:GNAT family N-acetyltransferase n=1 Tax=Cloacibacillus sp. An23 TaxID=1965591 RepID=UPI000B389D01|nr:GNAT family N-acetyltransferase [Cloacibacillus sp. An23]OUO95046.1 hypothetical protein B5F39_00485 [Cloacibacillus sp. An23]
MRKYHTLRRFACDDRRHNNDSYQEKYKQTFNDLNTEWIVKLFGKVEKEDTETFGHLNEILAGGAMIYLAVEGDKVLAVCMVRPTGNGEWEMCKMGAAGQCTGTGAGSAVFESCRNYALAYGAKRIFLLSNDKLKPALHIYEKFGFKEVKLENYEYERGNIAYEYIA